MRRCPQRELQNPRHAHRLTAFRVTNGVTEARVVVRCRSTRPTEPIGVRESHSDIRNVVNDACSRHVIDDLGEHPGESEWRLVLICDGRTASASTLMPDASTIEIGIVTGSFPSPTGLPSTNKFSVPGALALERPVLAGRGKLETQGIGDVPSGRHARRDAFAPRVRERAVQDFLMLSPNAAEIHRRAPKSPVACATYPASREAMDVPSAWEAASQPVATAATAAATVFATAACPVREKGGSGFEQNNPPRSELRTNNGCQRGGRGRPRRCPGARRAAATTCQ